MPWRASVAIHLTCSPRDASDGLDFYGRPTEAVFFHIPQRKRGVIIGFLIAAVVLHFASQAARIAFPVYETSESPPGLIIILATFVPSVLSGLIAGVVQAIELDRLKKANPTRFPRSSAEAVGRRAWQQFRQGHERNCCRLLASSITEFKEVQREESAKRLELQAKVAESARACRASIASVAGSLTSWRQRAQQRAEIGQGRCRARSMSSQDRLAQWQVRMEGACGDDPLATNSPAASERTESEGCTPTDRPSQKRVSAVTRRMSGERSPGNKVMFSFNVPNSYRSDSGDGSNSMRSESGDAVGGAVGAACATTPTVPVAAERIIQIELAADDEPASTNVNAVVLSPALKA